MEPIPAGAAASVLPNKTHADSTTSTAMMSAPLPNSTAAKQIAITGIGMASALGSSPEHHRNHIENHLAVFHPLANIPDPSLANSPFQRVNAAWIAHRASLTHRKFSPLTQLCLLVARDALKDSNHEPPFLEHAACFVGSSRGNLSGWLSPWPERRPFNNLAASNSVHSEAAAALTIEFGIRGPSHTLASGCAAGLEALGIAWLYLQSGLIDRALVVTAELPLVPALLTAYSQTGVLSSKEAFNPYAADTDGFLPGEGAAAFILEALPAKQAAQHPRITSYRANSEASNLLGQDKSGTPLKQLIETIAQSLDASGQPAIAHICPHASGTPTSRDSEAATFGSLYPNDADTHPPSLHLLKPFTGHTIGASGGIETAILTAFLRQAVLPPNLPDTTAPPNSHHPIPNNAIPATGTILKIASSMGGHHSALTLTPPDFNAKDENAPYHVAISIANQQLSVTDRHSNPQLQCPVSSATAGTGSEQDSLRTPTGNFIIREKIGHNAAIGTIFKGRKPSGILTPEAALDNKDHVLTRILRLHGTDPDNANTWQRYVYIHGTAQEHLIGQPASHGCIRLASHDLIKLFDLLPINTVVTID